MLLVVKLSHAAVSWSGVVRKGSQSGLRESTDVAVRMRRRWMDGSSVGVRRLSRQRSSEQCFEDAVW